MKFLWGAGCFFQKAALPLGERKTRLRVAFLIGVPVKSAFALLLEKVTKLAPVGADMMDRRNRFF